MKFKDNASPVGTLTVKIFNAITGELLEEWTAKNLIVNSGKSGMAHLLGEGGAYTDKKVYRIAFGTDGSDPTPADTAITGAYTKVLNSVTYPDDTSVLFTWSLAAAENNGMNIREFGLLTVDSTLYSRRTRAVIPKDSSLRLEGSWKIQF